MNDTKWRELRAAMLEISPAPIFRVLSTNGHLSRPDREWFYHFSDGGYDDIVHVEITPATPETRKAIHEALRRIHVPGEVMPMGFRVIGIAADGQELNYL
ncbi:MAG: DUF6678 family protein [Paracoccaceae bacterium]